MALLVGGRTQRQMHLINWDAELSSFYLDCILPWECGLLGIYRRARTAFTIEVHFFGSQPLTRDRGRDYHGIHVIVLFRQTSCRLCQKSTALAVSYPQWSGVLLATVVYKATIQNIVSNQISLHICPESRFETDLKVIFVEAEVNSILVALLTERVRMGSHQQQSK